MTKAPPSPPGLSPVARSWWAKIHAGWELDDSGRFLLEKALRATDLAAEARKAVAGDGIVRADGKLNPALSVVRDAENVALKAWRQLGLDITPAGPVGRPAGKKGVL